MRLLTRSDFDGSVCTAILEELGLIDDILYVHPKDMQDNKITVTENDILANVPFVNGCGLWFDHHSSERERLQLDGKFKGASKKAPSAAQVVYDYYKQNKAYADKLNKFKELIKIAGKADSAKFTKEEMARGGANARAKKLQNRLLADKLSSYFTGDPPLLQPP